MEIGLRPSCVEAMEQWTVSQNSFDRFLAVLDGDREIAGEKYEALRHRIVKFFEWRACATPEDLADQTLDRIVRKISLGEEIQDHMNYAYGVARFIYLENKKLVRREEPIEGDLVSEPSSDDQDELRMSCLEQCLSTLPENSRRIILGYYSSDRQAKIDQRKKIAEDLRISVNALRIKALRIRAKLEECVLKCVNKMPLQPKQNDGFYH
jgi:DNA-directed RNA polymerase specialized sigma24 family protein